MRTVRGCVLALLYLSASPPVRLSAQDSTRISEAQAVLAPLVESYGVSGTEGPVRETVKRTPAGVGHALDRHRGQPVGAGRPG